jgi:hypothetical protein
MSDTVMTGGIDEPLAVPKLPADIYVCIGTAVMMACAMIAVLSFALQYNGKAAIFLLDHGSRSLFLGLYPVTIQNFLHVLTASCLGILFHRWQRARFEESFLHANLLPTDDHILLSLDDLGKLRRRILPLISSGASLPALIDTAILLSMNTKSAEQAGSSVSAKLELISHRLDLEHQFVRQNLGGVEKGLINDPMFPLGSYVAGQPRHALSVRALWRSEQLRALTYAYVEHPATLACHIDLTTTIYDLETSTYRNFEQHDFEVPASVQLTLRNGIELSQSSYRISAPTPPDRALWNNKKTDLPRNNTPAQKSP